MQDVSGYGTRIDISANRSFPEGFGVTEFADDADPINTPDNKVADGKMGLNGSLITWSTANAVMLDISVVPNSEDDQNLAILLENNRPGLGKAPVQDIVFATIIWPDGSQDQFGPGRIMEGPPAKSVASAGRLKSRTYKFMFENKSNAA